MIEVLLVLAITAASFMFGFLVGWTIMQEKFYTPMRKNAEAASKGWEETINLLIQVAHTAGVQIKRPDGSVVSPIQIHRHD